MPTYHVKVTVEGEEYHTVKAADERLAELTALAAPHPELKFAALVQYVEDSDD